MVQYKGHGHTHIKKHSKHYRNNNCELILPDNNEVIGKVLKCNGSDARFTVIVNNIEYIAKARGFLIKGPKQQKINIDDYVLLVKDDTFSLNEKYFIIHKYSTDHIQQLIKQNILNPTNQYKDIENYQLDEDIDIAAI